MPFQIIREDITRVKVDAIVNPTDDAYTHLGGTDMRVHDAAGDELYKECKRHGSLNVGDVCITSSFNMNNCKYIIHAVGPDFGHTPNAFKELFEAYYNSLRVLKDNNLHSISFPLISSGIFGYGLDNPVRESTKQCIRAYNKFENDFPDYEINVLLCAFSQKEFIESQKEFNQ